MSSSQYLYEEGRLTGYTVISSPRGGTSKRDAGCWAEGRGMAVYG